MDLVSVVLSSQGNDMCVYLVVAQLSSPGLQKYAKQRPNSSTQMAQKAEILQLFSAAELSLIHIGPSSSARSPVNLTI